MIPAVLSYHSKRFILAPLNKPVIKMLDRRSSRPQKFNLFLTSSFLLFVFVVALVGTFDIVSPSPAYLCCTINSMGLYSIQLKIV